MNPTNIQSYRQVVGKKRKRILTLWECQALTTRGLAAQRALKALTGRSLSAEYNFLRKRPVSLPEPQYGRGYRDPRGRHSLNMSVQANFYGKRGRVAVQFQAPA